MRRFPELFLNCLARARIFVEGGFSILLLLALAGIFLAAYSETLSIVPLEREFFWKLSAFSERPLGCFVEGSRGNYPIGGSFFPGYSSIFPVLFGQTRNSIALAGALVSVSAGFLAYFVSRKLYGRLNGAILLSGLLFLPKLVPFVNIYNQETAVQGLVSLAFLSVLLLWLEGAGRGEGGKRLVLLLGLIAGIGILNKLFFILFLLACFASIAVLFRGMLAKMLRELPLFSVFLALGALPFIYYNFSFGFPTLRFIKAGAENLISAGGLAHGLFVRVQGFFLEISPVEISFFNWPFAALASSLIVLSVFFSKSREAKLVLLTAFLTIVLSLASYAGLFNQIHVSAVSPLIFVAFGALPFLLFGRAPESSELEIVLLPILLAGSVFSISSNILGLDSVYARLPSEPGESRHNSLQVSSCVDGAFVSYFSRAGESVLFNGTASCASDSFARTLPGKYLGSVEPPDLGDRLDSFVRGCEGDGFEFLRETPWYAKDIRTHR